MTAPAKHTWLPLTLDVERPADLTIAWFADTGRTSRKLMIAGGFKPYDPEVMPYVVRAVNAHEAMREALAETSDALHAAWFQISRAAHKRHEMDDDEISDLVARDPVLIRARTALLLAEGK